MKLVLRSDGVSGSDVAYALDRGLLEIGRDQTCDVRIDEADRAVSRRHAGIERQGERFIVVDRGSTNGTWLNGRRVERAILANGDRVRLGMDGPCLRAEIERDEEIVSPPKSSMTAHLIARGATLMSAGQFDPDHDKGRRYSWSAVGVVFGMLGLGGALGFLVLLMSLFALGPIAAISGVTVAFVAAPFYLSIWLWLDRYDPEPVWVLAGVLLWGAGAATFVSGFLNVVFSLVVHTTTGSAGLANILAAGISAPIVEEASKGTAVLLVFLFLRREFDGVLDGIVYSGVVALAFAAVENVLYYGRIVNKAGLAGLILVFILRGILGPFSHAVFTSVFGVGCGIARASHNQAVRVLAPVAGYLGAVLLHSFWNVVSGLFGLGGFLLAYLVVWGPLFFFFFSVVIFMGFREAQLIRRMLAFEVARGLLTRERAAIIVSWPRRMLWFLGAWSSWSVLSARREYVYAATRLALSHAHAERAAAAGGETMSAAQIPVHRATLMRLREEV